MFFNSSKNQSPISETQAEDAVKMLTTISPLVSNLYSGRTMFAINQGLTNLTELFFYLLGLMSIAFSFIMNTVFPFHVLGEIISKRAYEMALTSKGDIQLFSIAVKGLVIFIGVLFIFIGILIRKTGKRKSLLQNAGKELKLIETYFLEIQKAQPKTTTENKE